MTEMAEVREVWPSSSPARDPRSPDDVLGALDEAVARARAGEGEQGLRTAIDAARAAGVPWGTIGDRLGMARGNAYQKYRRRPA